MLFIDPSKKIYPFLLATPATTPPLMLRVCHAHTKKHLKVIYKNLKTCLDKCETTNNKLIPAQILFILAMAISNFVAKCTHPSQFFMDALQVVLIIIDFSSSEIPNYFGVYAFLRTVGLI